MNPSSRRMEEIREEGFIMFGKENNVEKVRIEMICFVICDILRLQVAILFI